MVLAIRQNWGLSKTLGSMLPDPLSPDRADIERVRAELQAAIDRARAHLEWAEIALIMSQRRMAESTKGSAGIDLPGALASGPDPTMTLALPIQSDSVGPTAGSTPSLGADQTA